VKTNINSQANHKSNQLFNLSLSNKENNKMSTTPYLVLNNNDNDGSKLNQTNYNCEDNNSKTGISQKLKPNKAIK